MGLTTTPFRDPEPGWTAARDERRAQWSAALVELGAAREIVAERVARAAPGAVVLGGLLALALVWATPMLRPSYEPVLLCMGLMGVLLLLRLAKGLGRIAGEAWLARRLVPGPRLDVAEEAAFYARDPRVVVRVAAARVEAVTLWLELVAGATWLPIAALHVGAVAGLCWLITEPLAVVTVVFAIVIGGFAVAGGWIWPLVVLHAVVVVRWRAAGSSWPTRLGWAVLLVVTALGPLVVFSDELPVALFASLAAGLQLALYAAVEARVRQRRERERRDLA